MVRLVRLLMVIVVSSLGVTVMTLPGLRGAQRPPTLPTPLPQDDDKGDAVYRSAGTHPPAVDVSQHGFEPLPLGCPDDPVKPEPVKQPFSADLKKCLKACHKKKSCTHVSWSPVTTKCVLLPTCWVADDATGFIIKRSEPAKQQAIKNVNGLTQSKWVTVQNVKYKNYLSLPYDTLEVSRKVQAVAHETHGTKGWAFRTVLGTYVSAETNGHLSADRHKPRSMEHFTVEFIGKSDVAIIRCTKSRKLVAGTKDMKLQARVATQDDTATHFVIYETPPPSEAAAAPNRDPSICTGLGQVLLFTSPKPVKGGYSHRHATVLGNWKHLPCIAPLVISDDASTLSATEQHGIATDDKLEIQSAYSQPTYRGLFDAAFRHSKGTYAMYSNSDIMYSTNLAETVAAVLKFKEASDTYRDAPLLVVGQRTNAAVGDDWAAGDKWYEGVEDLEREGALFQPDAEDYFLVSRDLTKWKDMPDFVVGGAAFDNWFVSKVVRSAKPVLTVDATRTATAVHMDHETNRPCGSKCSHTTPKSAYNTKLASSHGGTARGTTGDCEYATVRTFRGIEVLKRNQFYL